VVGRFGPQRSGESCCGASDVGAGIDISHEYPKPFTDEIVQAADVVITMGCGDTCPVIPGRRYEEWTFDDPAGRDVDAVRPIRDAIEQRVRRLLTELNVAVRA